MRKKKWHWPKKVVDEFSTRFRFSPSNKRVMNSITFLAFFSLAVVVFRGILFTSRYAFWSDVRFYLDFAKLGNQLSFAWASNYNLGYANHVPYVPFVYVFAVLSKMGLPSNLLSQLYYLWPYFLLGYSMYFFASCIGLSTPGKIMAGFIYLVNPWRLAPAEFYAVIGVILLPVAIGLYIKYQRMNKVELLLASSLIVFLPFTMALVYWIVIYGMVIFLDILITCCLRGHGHRLKKIFRGIQMLTVVGVTALLLSSYWTLPYLYDNYVRPANLGRPFVYYPFDQLEQAIFNSHDLYTLLALYIPGMDNQFSWLGYVLLGFAFAGWLVRRNSISSLLLISCIVFLFLSKGMNEPFGEVYGWLFMNMPLFNVLRASTKFLNGAVFCYAGLIGIFFDWLFKQTRDLNSRVRYRITFPLTEDLHDIGILARNLSLLAIIISSVFSSYPTLTGDYKDNFALSSIPDSYFKLKDQLASSKDDFGVMFLPPDGAGQGPQWINYSYPVNPSVFMGYDKQIENPSPGEEYLNIIPLLGEDFLIYSYGCMVDERTNYIGKLLEPMNVKYIVLQRDVRNEPLVAHLKQHIATQKDLTLNSTYDAFDVYRNTRSCAKFMLASNPIFVIGDRDSFLALNTIEGFDPLSSPLIFLNQAPNRFSDLINLNATTILIHDKNYLDFILETIDNKYLIDPTPYAKQRRYDPANMWGSSTWDDYDIVYRDGVLVSCGGYVHTRGNATMEIPFSIDTTSRYLVYMKILVGENKGRLHISIDDTLMSDVATEMMPGSGFKWINVPPSLNLEKGKHVMRINNLAVLNHADNYINQIAIVAENYFDNHTANLDQTLKGRHLEISYLLEAEKLNYDENWKNMKIKEASNAFALVPSGNNKTCTLQYDFYIPYETKIKLATRIKSEKQESCIVYIDSTRREYEINGSEQCFLWYELESFQIGPGNHTLRFTLVNSGETEIDQIAIMDQSSRLSEGSLFLNHKSRIESVIRVNPSEYVLQCKLNGTALLVFCENWHYLWRLSIDEHEIKPILVNSYANGFPIQGNGKISLRISYAGQRVFIYGQIISATTLFVLVSILVYKLSVGSIRIFWKKPLR